MISRIKDYLEFHEKKDRHQSDIQFFRSLLAYVEGLEAELAPYRNEKNWTRPFDFEGKLINEHALYLPKILTKPKQEVKP